MLIGEICKKTELSRDTIRFYEKKGLIKVKQTESEFNNYKDYTEQNLRRLLLIRASSNHLQSIDNQRIKLQKSLYI